MRWIAVVVVCALVSQAPASRPPDIPFKAQMIDNGASETAAVADVNRDGRPDIVSGEFWYQGPAWTKHRFRELGFSTNYIDNFSDLPVDVDEDGYPDIVSVSWFARKIAWWRNPGTASTQKRLRPEQEPSAAAARKGAARPALGVGPQRDQEKPKPPSLPSSQLWAESVIHSGFNVEFAILADLDNDGRANEVVAQENGTGQAWYEPKNGAWVAHVVSDRTYGHGIGAGDVNKDGRTDILTPRGWLEAPADPRAGNWSFHAAWESINMPASSGAAPPAASPAAPPSVLSLGFMHVLDVNGDGRNDVVTAAGHDYGVFWFEQGDGGKWTRRTIDSTWSQGHASTLVDLNGDGRLDLVTGKRYMAHNGSDPGEREPLGVYWYESRPAFAPARGEESAGASARQGPAAVEWVRHLIDYSSRVGGGLQIPVVDVDGDGDLDLVCAGKSGLFLLENLTKGPAYRANKR
jgi:VCBS repeat protein